MNEMPTNGLALFISCDLIHVRQSQKRRQSTNRRTRLLSEAAVDSVSCCTRVPDNRAHSTPCFSVTLNEIRPGSIHVYVCARIPRRVLMRCSRGVLNPHEGNIYILKCKFIVSRGYYIRGHYAVRRETDSLKFQLFFSRLATTTTTTAIVVAAATGVRQ